MNLLLFNLATDADDPILGFTTGWINRLAAHYEHIDVITMRAGRLEIASNVHVYSIGKERGYGEARRAVEFYRLLSRLLSRRRYAACFAHMQPLFALLAAPLLRPFNVPITLWYTHRQRHRTLELATRVSWRVVTAAPDSFPIATPKLRVLGHGIDTDFFNAEYLRVGNEPQEQFRDAVFNSILGSQDLGHVYVIHVARLMPIKHQATLIRALPDVPAVHAVFVGAVPPEQGIDYRAELEALTRDLGVAERVTFAGNQSAGGVRAWYARAAAAVNLSPVGLFDKAALEALAMCVPTIVTNPSFDPLLSAANWRIDAPEDHTGLAARLTAVLALDPAERERLTQLSRARTVEAHGLDGLIRRLVQVLNTGEMI